MKTINSFRSKLLALTLALVFTPTLWAERFEYNQIYYNTLNDSTAEVTYQTEWSSPSYNHTSVIIPSIVEYNGKVYSIVRIEKKTLLFLNILIVLIFTFWKYFYKTKTNPVQILLNGVLI